jgi:serine/threonine-protein kinase
MGGSPEPEMKGTKNREAWNAYMTGLHYYNRDNREASKRTLNSLKEAIRLDPNFARPYAALSDIYRWNDDLFPSSKEALTKAKEATLQALAHDDSLAQAHKELAYVSAHLDRDLAKATKEFKRAIELDPHYATGHAAYGWFLLGMGQVEEAKKEVRLAVTLDPIFPRIRCVASGVFLSAGDLDEAIGQARTALDLDPNCCWALDILREIQPSRCHGRRRSPAGCNQRRQRSRAVIWAALMRPEAHEGIGRRNSISHKCPRIMEATFTTRL